MEKLQNMKEMKRLVGSEVQINFAGPEKSKGTLRAIKRDYCALESKEGIYYYAMHHIKSMSMFNEVDNAEEHENKEDKNEESKDEEKSTCSDRLFRGLSFVTLLDSMKGHLIQINRKLKGTLQGRSGNTLILESKGETIFVPLFHIQSVKIDNKNKQEQGENKEQDDQTKQDKNGNKEQDDKITKSKNEDTKKSYKNEKEDRRYDYKYKRSRGRRY
ncbi:hypothetical protein P6P90_09385 [Ectobacillus antri]|uniref:DUF2642 domain-containing protein n=1 Tax=Ectobacillus antri TaxID=2486280 RepID=A0ABT6H6C5_9BACI|nr:hypothetical protein [Ectobacillus antri]MDG4657080.1 hypothetical protein [Ectobacillus antri]MDG5754182.1 hypothetical protein [Ectobacillus antri]